MRRIRDAIAKLEELLNLSKDAIAALNLLRQWLANPTLQCPVPYGFY